MEDGISDIANFGFSNSGGDQELKEESQENVGEMSKGDKEGGVINNLISNLMSPRAGEPKNKERNDLFEAYDKEKSSDESNGGGGIINNLISNIFHPTENSVENQEVQKGEMKKTEEESGSVLDNIMSHLPTPLADDAVPATDEASILIHSIVHD
ncbi:hypothetical protein AABB24_015620 [Solanum stoloniferum]|uniref:Uncharacterized protein n=2 Tax=Solanum TaxID=4107 RepID=A0AAF0ZMX3_SOLVR|nr:uncharacterized protein LOC125817045 [Solanum verrucosum]KAH0635845.1 hypothetical protein KY289_035760 [Solanum tuberosum]WMV45076.1 hypothetical protein MTR67_038461 [Solanum verrucosum]